MSKKQKKEVVTMAQNINLLTNYLRTTFFTQPNSRHLCEEWIKQRKKKALRLLNLLCYLRVIFSLHNHISTSTHQHSS